MSWLSQFIKRDWHKISLQGILGLVGVALPLLAIHDPKAAAAVAIVISGVTSSVAAYQDTLKTLATREALPPSDRDATPPPVVPPVVPLPK